MARHLAHKERVAPRAFYHLTCEARRHAGRAQGRNQRSDLAGFETGDDDARHCWFAPQVCEQFTERMTGADFARAIGSDQQERGRLGSSNHVAQHRQRRLVGPVKIVDENEHRHPADIVLSSPLTLSNNR